MVAELRAVYMIPLCRDATKRGIVFDILEIAISCGTCLKLALAILFRSEYFKVI